MVYFCFFFLLLLRFELARARSRRCTRHTLNERWTQQIWPCWSMRTFIGPIWILPERHPERHRYRKRWKCPLSISPVRCRHMLTTRSHWMAVSIPQIPHGWRYFPIFNSIDVGHAHAAAVTQTVNTLANARPLFCLVHSDIRLGHGSRRAARQIGRSFPPILAGWRLW